MPKLIVGLGTGRCGTWSLTKFFQKQENFSSTHEAYFLPWRHDCLRCYSVIVQLFQNQTEYISDVGFYWIKYVEDAISILPDTKFICLKRERSSVVESFDHNTPYTNYWTDIASVHWDWKMWEISHLNAMFPSYDLPKREAIGKYWDEYYTMASAYEKTHPNNFKIFDVNNLNTKDGQNSILDFVGFPSTGRSVGTENHENATDGKVVINIDDFRKYDKEDSGMGLCGECEKRPPTKVVQNRSYNMQMHVCSECVEVAEKKLIGFLAEYNHGRKI